MRWFKHMSDASEDEFISHLEAALGLEGYARWWKLLEKIASQMDKTGRCYASYPVSKWMGYLGCKQKKILELFLNFLLDHRKISYNQHGNILTIECTKLLEYRDEFTRKSGAKKESVAPETEADTETEKKDTPPPLKRVGDVSVDLLGDGKDVIPAGFEESWKVWPRKDAKKKALKSWITARRKTEFETIFQAIHHFRSAYDADPRAEDGDNGKRRFCPHFSTWLNGECWKDFENHISPANNPNLTKAESIREKLLDCGITPMY